MGIAFTLKGVGIISARHVFDYAKEEKLCWRLMRATAPFDEFQINGFKQHPAIDITIISSSALSSAKLRPATKECVNAEDVSLLGFPNWHTQGDEPVRLAAQIIQIKPISGIAHLAVDKKILSGASGGPVLNDLGHVSGVIVHGDGHPSMPNSFISIGHVNEVRTVSEVYL